MITEPNVPRALEMSADFRHFYGNPSLRFGAAELVPADLNGDGVIVAGQIRAVFRPNHLSPEPHQQRWGGHGEVRAESQKELNLFADGKRAFYAK